MTILCVYGFILFTLYLSFTDSSLMPKFNWVGLLQYEKLWADPKWYISLANLGIYGGLYICISTAIGLMLAILLDQRIRIEGALRTIYLYPMAISFIVTGTAWKWVLNPGLGLDKLMHDLGWTSFSFDWLINSEMAIYTIVIAGVWQSSGFVMAMFLAGLRGVDSDILKAAAIDGATLPQTYRRIIIPLMRPVFLSAFVVSAHLAIKSFDLVKAMTDGGPGTSTWTPAVYMYTTTFTRNQMGLGAASAVIMLATISAIIVPYLYSELRGGRRD
ncbi:MULTISPECIES: sugar ABC transporter permease [unclassified Inquilinus]|uniref:Glucose/mannose transport system permease protein n=1 Tax=Inquilinus ginsengisoli TaxID=363840 RepID=A0ABU1JPV6_9PROT|nr:sugar ABC transporter permease [Inquilinus ginsengisoli]MDR6290653.1 glucose/mannose transport system permease protein [Inquilinus ginsengisoli]